MRPPGYYDQDFMAQYGGRIDGVPLYSNVFIFNLIFWWFAFNTTFDLICLWPLTFDLTFDLICLWHNLIKNHVHSSSAIKWKYLSF